jgi:hypothetical protein
VEQKKLSDYMLEGIKQTKPLQYDWMHWEDGPYYCCPIGAACYAKDPVKARELLDPDEASGVAYEMFPELAKYVEWRGLDGKHEPVPVALMNLITTLNDGADWRRDRTARYVAKLGY